MKTTLNTNPSDFALAKSILNGDIITQDEIVKVCGEVVYTDSQIVALATSLPSVEDLIWCKNNDYAMMPAPPSACSTLDVREIYKIHFPNKKGGSYNDERYLQKDRTSFEWLAIRKVPVPKSTGLHWFDQTYLLSSELERVPNAAEISWFIVTYFEVRAIRLFPDVIVRTSSLSDDDPVCTGNFASSLIIEPHSCGERNGHIGISSARK